MLVGMLTGRYQTINYVVFLHRTMHVSPPRKSFVAPKINMIDDDFGLSVTQADNVNAPI